MRPITTSIVRAGRRAASRGLTLVELIIVITIIGVLTAAILGRPDASQEDRRHRDDHDRVQHGAERDHHVEERPPERGLPFNRQSQEGEVPRVGLQLEGSPGAVRSS